MHDLEKRIEHHSPQYARLFYLKLILMVGLLGLAYVPVLECGFIWDDDAYVIHNSTLRDVDGLVRIWTQPRNLPQYYPLVHTTFWLEYQTWGLEPVGYHVVNVLLHLAVALLWWVLLRRMGLPCAWLAAMLFALHPVHVESVAWITERKNVLSGVFYLLAAISYWQFYLSESKPTSKRWGWYALAILCFIAALLSKTITATMPAALILMLWYHRRRFPVRDFLLLLPMFVLGMVMGLYTAHMEATHVGAFGNEFSLSFLERFLLAGRVIWTYCFKLLWPGELVFFYPRWLILPQTLMAWLYPVGVILVAVMLLKNRKVWGGYWLVCWLFFIGTLFPALGFLNVFPMKYSWVADHFQYLASMGVLVTVAMVLHAMYQRQLRLGGLLIALVLLSLTARTYLQVPVYGNLQTLWEHVVEHNPNSWAAKNNLGAIYAQNGRLAQSRTLFRQSLVLNPQQTKGYENLGSYHFKQRDWAKAEFYFRICLDKEPGNIQIRLKCATACRKQDKLDEALKHAAECVRRKVDDLDSWTVLASLYAQRSEHDNAIKAWQRAIVLSPTQGYLHYSLGLSAAAKRDYALATQAQQQAAKYESTLAAPYSQLALLAVRQQQWDQALEMIGKAHGLEPDNAVVTQRMIWFFVTLPNTTKQHYQQAMALVRQHIPKLAVECQDTRWAATHAAVLARHGKYESAIAWQKRALELAEEQRDPMQVQRLKQNLQRYANKQSAMIP